MKRILNCLALIVILSTVTPSCKKKDTLSENQDTSQSASINPEWAKDATIYEVNIRQYSEEGTFDAFAEHLPRLKELGVKILWFMPVFPISEKDRKGNLGSYYAVQDYNKINPHFGTMDDFKKLVNQAHDLGFKVILDWVPNHSGRDNPWIEKHPEYYVMDSTGVPAYDADWSDTAKLDYSNDSLRNAMIESMLWWIKEADIDGYRCDVAGFVPSDFWKECIDSLQQEKEIFMLAEDAEDMSLLESGFVMNYSWPFHHLLNDIAVGKKDATDLMDYYSKALIEYPDGTYPMNFITNHDENSWNGTIDERLGPAADAMAVLTFLTEGMPLVYSGQEADLNKRLEFFEKDRIDWSDLSKSEFYKKLISLKKENPALWNGTYGSPIVVIQNDALPHCLSIIRQKEGNTVIGLFNFTEEPIQTTLEGFSGDYEEYFSSYSENLKEPISLDKWGYKVLTRKIE